MDSWIIARLEALMLRSPVSPYDVARFLSVGVSVAAALVVYEHFARGEWVWCLFWMPFVAAFRLYRDSIAEVERQNARGLINKYKSLEDVVWRYVGWLALALDFIGLVDLVDPLVASMAFLMAVFLGFRYFEALNWTPPPPKSVWRKAAEAGAT